LLDLKESSEYSDRITEARKLRIHGQLNDAQVILDSFTAIEDYMQKTDDFSELLYERGCLFLGRGQYEESMRIFGDLVSRNDSGTTLGAGLGYNGQGLCFLANGHHSLAMDLFRRTLEIYELLDYRKGIAGVLGNTSECLLELGEVKRSKAYLQRALDISKDSNYDYGVAWATAGLGVIFAVENHLEESKNMFLEALQQLESLGIEKVWVLCEAAEVFSLLGEHQFAENLLERAMKTARNGSEGDLAKVQLQWGLLEFERGNLGLASHHFQGVLSRSNEVKVRARAYIQMARIHLSKYHSQSRDYLVDEIAYFVDKAMALAEKPTPRVPLIVEISLVKAGLLEAQFDFDRSIEILQETEQQSRQTDIPTLSKKIKDQIIRVRKKRMNILRLMESFQFKNLDTSQYLTQEDAKSYLEEALRAMGRGQR